MDHTKFVMRDGRTVYLRPAMEKDAGPFIQAIDSISREQVYFIRSRFDVEEEKEQAFIAKARRQGDLMLVAVNGTQIVGWVTLFRSQAEFQRHTAQLGMGVVQGYRGAGLGTTLMDHALAWAAENGIEKVKLGVRASNGRARSLYDKFGFVEEGYRVRDIKDTHGRYDDHVEMSYFVTQTSSPLAEGLQRVADARAS
jgi:ribosomal protein S18 acetylase RimI-like enzyme